jgi:BASS family bile acid:Na+ symporter
MQKDHTPLTGKILPVLSARLTALFPLWAILASAAALFWPAPFVASKPAIVPLLGVIMLGMGLTLTWNSFTRVFTCPRFVAGGVFLQFFLMPLFAWGIARLLHLDQALTAGLVLVGACPGGTASNVICFLAGGDVALSITLTACSTILAVFLTPFLTWFYVGQVVPVPVVDMFLSIVKIVLIPVGAGVALNTLFGGHFKKVKPVFPVVSVGSIVFIIAIVVALNRQNFHMIGAAAALAVVLHNLAGLLAGYWAARIMGWERQVCRTIAIEVGMQNSGLGVALAMKYFSAAAALPGAIFSIWHNFSGSLVASYWSRHKPGP